MWDGRLTPGMVVYLTIGGFLVVFSFLSGFSIGMFVMPIPVVMFLGLLIWKRRWLVAGIVAGVTAASFAYIVTAPVTCWESSGEREAGGTITTWSARGCRRMLLPDFRGHDTTAADQLTRRITLGSGLGVGALAALVTAAVTRGRQRSGSDPGIVPTG